jgi:hypothetical protein
MGMPVWIVAITQSTAAAMLGKAQTAADTASGWPCRRRVSSVIRPSVPSDPTNSAVRSYPAEDLGAPVPVRMIRPSARTTSSASTLARIVP